MAKEKETETQNPKIKKTPKIRMTFPLKVIFPKQIKQERKPVSPYLPTQEMPQVEPCGL